MKRDSLEGSGHTPMYNPNILPFRAELFLKKLWCDAMFNFSNMPGTLRSDVVNLL